MHYFKQILLLSASLWLLASCSSKTKNEKPAPDFIPVQTQKDGKWGMLSPEGKLLFSDRFESEPSIALEGRFSVAEGDAFSIYSAEAKPVKINKKPLASVGNFCDGLAPVSYKGSRITIIDTQGNDVATLMPVGGKELLKSDVSFRDGLLLVTTADGKLGYVDKKGEPVIKPTYDAALPFAYGYTMVARVTDPADPTNSLRVSIIDTKGDVVLNVAQQYTVIDLDLRFKRLIVKNISGKIGFLSFDDEFTEAPPTVVNIGEVTKNNYVFSNENGLCGVMGNDGKSLLDPKYDSLAFVGTDKLIAHSGLEWSLIDLNGTSEVKFGQASNVGYMEGFGFLAFDKLSVRLLDMSGKPKTKMTLFAAGFNASACSSVRSDYKSAERLATEIAKLAEGAGILGLPWGTPAQRLAAAPDAATGNYAAMPGASLSAVDFLINCVGVFTETVGIQGYNEQTGAGYNFNPAAGLCGADFYLRTEAPMTDAYIRAIINALSASGFRLKSQSPKPGFFEMESATSVIYFARMKGNYDANFYIGELSRTADNARWRKILSDSFAKGALPTTEQLFGGGSLPESDSSEEFDYVDRTQPRRAATDSGESVSSRPSMN